MKNSIRLPDLRGFIESLKLDFYGAIYDVTLRYALSQFSKLAYSPGDLASWESMFRSILNRRRFLLIVLDSARFDVFKRLYPRYLKGSLLKARVPPPHTYGWLPSVLSTPEFNNVRVFYARLNIRTHDIRLKDFIPKDRSVEVYAIEPKTLKWLKTVTPSEVNDTIKNIGLSGRDIVWYVQPHFPWICDAELSLKLMRDALIHDFIPPDTINRALKKYGVSRSRVVKAYYCNMIIALKGVKELLNHVYDLGVKYDEIVITSDHGEMLGEYGLYLHQEYDLPQLTVVPWLEVEL